MLSRKYFNEEKKFDIFHKTEGQCYYCDKKLYFNNRQLGQRGAWHVEHKNPLSKGGTNHGRNLVPACINCNLEKGNQTASQFINNYVEPDNAEFSWEDAIAKGIMGAAIGGALGGKNGAIAGSLIAQLFD